MEGRSLLTSTWYVVELVAHQEKCPVRDGLSGLLCRRGFGQCPSTCVRSNRSRPLYFIRMTLTRCTDTAMFDKQATIINRQCSSPIPSPPASRARWVGPCFSYLSRPSLADHPSFSGPWLVLWRRTSGRL